MKKLFTLALSALLMGSVAQAQDVGITEIFVLSDINPWTPIDGDSAGVGDTVAIGMTLHNFGSGILNNTDSVAMGWSFNGVSQGTLSAPQLGTNIVPTQSANLIVNNSYIFNQTGDLKICAWTSYTPLGGDPNKANDTACKTFKIYQPLMLSDGQLEVSPMAVNIRSFNSSLALEFISQDFHELKVNLYNLVGNRVFSRDIEVNGSYTGSYALDIPSGIYIAEIRSGNDVVATEKIYWR
ncbi:hypothetical protein KFE98_00200 [bacterium SCSIO 12741]|nr:hypothetical protein KFE98_00200 [bacterium SCSIO 12741]